MGKTSGSGSRNPDLTGGLRNNFFGLKYLNSLMRIRDPGSGRIRDGKNSDPVSGINILDPQHCLQGFRYGSAIFLEAGSGFAFGRKAGSGSASKSKFRKFRGSNWCGGPWTLKMEPQKVCVPMAAVKHHPDKGA